MNYFKKILVSYWITFKIVISVLAIWSLFDIYHYYSFMNLHMPDHYDTSVVSGIHVGKNKQGAVITTLDISYLKILELKAVTKQYTFEEKDKVLSEDIVVRSENSILFEIIFFYFSVIFAFIWPFILIRKYSRGHRGQQLFLP